MKPIGTFDLGGGITLNFSADKSGVELAVKLLTTMVFKKTVTADKAEELSALIDWAVTEARKP